MPMTAWNGDLTQSLKWMQANAPNIQSLVDQKVKWYQQFHYNFWNDWATDIFNLQTATPFGLLIWCIILNVPSQLFGLYPLNAAWAYGPERENYIYKSSTQPPVTNPNTVGGNFAGGGQSTLLNLNEVRWALQLRYAALISNGRISFINNMLRFIFNNNKPWNFPNKIYFYVVDNTAPAQTLVPTAPVTQDHYMEYRIGAGLPISGEFLNLMNSPQYGIVPSCVGTKYLVVQET